MPISRLNLSQTLNILSFYNNREKTAHIVTIGPFWMKRNFIVIQLQRWSFHSNRICSEISQEGWISLPLSTWCGHLITFKQLTCKLKKKKHVWCYQELDSIFLFKEWYQFSNLKRNDLKEQLAVKIYVPCKCIINYRVVNFWMEKILWQIKR